MASAPVVDRRLDHDCPDDVLVERARARDAEAFGTLVCRHQPKLRRLVARILDTAPDQDEALQNAFLSAWRHLPEFQGRSQFSSWMYRVTTNAAFMLLRYQGRRPHAPVADVQASAEGCIAITPLRPIHTAALPEGLGEALGI